MNSIVHADIFFFIATCGLVVFIIVGAVAAFYGVLIARDVRYVIKKVKEESDNISEDIAVARQKIRDQGMKVATFFGVIKNFITFKNFRSEKPNHDSSESTEKTDHKNHAKKASKIKID